MLKGRWRLIYKKCESKTHNVKYVVMTCVFLHNLCNARLDPCNPRWKLHVDELSLVEKIFLVQKTKVNYERLPLKLLSGCGSMDKIISYHQLFLMKNTESKKVVFYFGLCPFALIFKVYPILYMLFYKNILYKNIEAANETKL